MLYYHLWCHAIHSCGLAVLMSHRQETELMTCHSYVTSKCLTKSNESRYLHVQILQIIDNIFGIRSFLVSVCTTSAWSYVVNKHNTMHKHKPLLMSENDAVLYQLCQNLHGKENLSSNIKLHQSPCNISLCSQSQLHHLHTRSSSYRESFKQQQCSRKSCISLKFYAFCQCAQVQ